MLAVPTEAVIPQKLTRSQVREWLDGIGVSTKGLVRLTVERGGISFEVHALDETGAIYAVGTTEPRAATHTITIPIVEDDEDG